MLKYTANKASWKCTYMLKYTANKASWKCTC